MLNKISLRLQITVYSKYRTEMSLASSFSIQILVAICGRGEEVINACVSYLEMEEVSLNFL